MIARGAKGSAERDVLRVAVPKGALFDGATETLALAGYETAALEDLGRLLSVTCGGVEYVVAKPWDVPVFVAHGAADCGIAGADSIIEAGLDLVEMVDLGFGACRFVVAEPEDADGTVDEQYRHLGVMRVATKYPRVTERHFAEQGVQVEIVKLYGNIELAPMTGLAERIVDITATGTTLRENRLRIVEEVLDSTARFVANPAALRTRPQVAEMAARLAGAVR